MPSVVRGSDGKFYVSGTITYGIGALPRDTAGMVVKELEAQYKQGKRDAINKVRESLGFDILTQEEDWRL